MAACFKMATLTCKMKKILYHFPRNGYNNFLLWLFWSRKPNLTFFKFKEDAEFSFRWLLVEKARLTISKRLPFVKKWPHNFRMKNNIPLEKITGILVSDKKLLNSSITLVLWVHTHAHACMHALMHAHTHVHTHAHTHAHVHALMHARTHTHTHVRTHAHTHAHF